MEHTAGKKKSILKRILIILLIILAVIIAAVCILNFALPHVTTKPTYDDVYVATVSTTEGEKDLNMDVFLPDEADEPTPLVIVIHGGQWEYESYNLGLQRTGLLYPVYGNQYPQVFSLLDDGIAIASIDYRYSAEAVFPAQIHDIKAYIRYMRAHAEEYNIDPDRIAVFGVSAGAMLATLCAMTNGEEYYEGTVGDCLDTSSDVNACVDFYGITDFTTISADLKERTDITTVEDVVELVDVPTSSRSALFGLTDEDTGLGVVVDNPEQYPEEYELLKMGSSYYHIEGNEPPIFIGQGNQDFRTAAVQSQKLYDELISKGVDATLMINPDAGHGDLGDEIYAGMKEFLYRVFDMN